MAGELCASMRHARAFCAYALFDLSFKLATLLIGPPPSARSDSMLPTRSSLLSAHFDLRLDQTVTCRLCGSRISKPAQPLDSIRAKDVELLNVGKRLYSRGCHDDALVVLGHSIELESTNVTAHAFRIFTFYSLGRYVEAHEAIDRAQSLVPDDVRVHIAAIYNHPLADSASIPLIASLILAADKRCACDSHACSTDAVSAATMSSVRRPFFTSKDTYPVDTNVESAPGFSSQLCQIVRNYLCFLVSHTCFHLLKEFFSWVDLSQISNFLAHLGSLVVHHLLSLVT